MTYVEDIKIDPVTGIASNKWTMGRGLALIASIAALVLPAISSTAMGITQNVNIAGLAAWAFIAPLAVAVALIMPGVAPRFRRLADIFAAALVTVVVGYVAYLLVDALSQVSQASSMVQGLVGDDPYAQSYARSLNASLGIAVAPSLGLYLMAASAALMWACATLNRK